jgi:hypothetical protein
MLETLQSEILSGKEALSTLAKGWDELFERATAAPPYLSRAWLSTFISEGRLRGTPLFIQVKPSVKFINICKIMSYIIIFLAISSIPVIM